MKKIILPISLMLNVLLLTVSCAHKYPSGKPVWQGKIWAGSSNLGGFRRAQSNEEMSCLQPKIDNYVAISYNDLQCLFDQMVQNCVAYKNPNMTCKSDGKVARSFVRNLF